MENKTLSEINYKNYKVAAWRGNTTLQNKYKKIWLNSMETDLPNSAIRRKYINRIKHLQTDGDFFSSKIEKRLLKKRFAFSAKVDDRYYGYRGLLTLAKEERVQNNIRQALIDETYSLLDAGFTELVQYRNKKARNKGYENYWQMKNSAQNENIQHFLIQMDISLRNIPVQLHSVTVENTQLIDLEKAIDFFCSLLFVRTKIPQIDVKIRKGADCPPGPPSVQTLEYRLERGHLLGLDLPFVHHNKFKQEYLGTLFHELSHLFHFATVDTRGSYAFPAELASNNLLYESEALCYQNIILTAWNGGHYVADLDMLKDLVYLAETERQLYSLETISNRNIKELIMRRIYEQYPDGNFIRTPLGASHLISEETAGSYWIYPAAHWQSIERAKNILSTQKYLTVPTYWKEGNEASFNLPILPMENLSTGGDIYPISADKVLIEPQNLKRWEREDTHAELERIGLYDRLLS